MGQKTQTRGKLSGALLVLATALAMAACLLPGMAQKAYADGTHTHDGVAFVEWTDGLAQEQNGPSSTAANSLPGRPGNYYLTKDVTLTDRWNTPDGTTNLCLGGKTITGKLSESANHDSSVVNIERDSTLNLYDDEEGTGKIVSEEYVYSDEGSNLTVLVRVVGTYDGVFNMYGGTLCATEGNQVFSGVNVNGGSFTMHGGTIKGARSSGVDVGSRDGVFTMNGGTITGNRALHGGGVFVQKDSMFTMNGGNITGNEAFTTETKDEDGFPMYKGGQGGGVYVEAGDDSSFSGTFTMNGGSITGNEAQRRGGGVYNTGTFNLSGASEINGNVRTHKIGDPDADNVYLERDKVVNVAGELTGTKPIGITMQAEGVFTSGKASGYKAKFASDDEEFVVVAKGKELMLQHLKHSMSYFESGATVTAECAWPESCSLPDGQVALTIKAPTLTTYGGAGSAAATLEGLADFNEACGLSLKAADIKYYKAKKDGSAYVKDGAALGSAPTGAGDYLAEMPVPTDSEGSYVYVNVGYTIAKGDTIDKGGAIDKGDTLDKGDISQAKVELSQTSYTYDGKAKEPAVTVTLGGKVLVAGTDYDVAYAGNVQPGTATVTVTGKGAYKGSATATFTVKLKKAAISTVARPGAKAMQVKWKKVAGAEKYQLQWSERGGKWKSKTVKSTKATVKGMKRGKLYDVRVRAIAGSTKGTWSAQSHRWFVTQSSVKAASAKAGAVKVTWEKMPKANAGYKIVVRYSKAGKVVATKTVKPGKTSATVKGLAPGKKAWVQVRPLRKAGGSTYAGILTRAKSSVKVSGKSGAKPQSSGALAAAAI